MRRCRSGRAIPPATSRLKVSFSSSRSNAGPTTRRSRWTTTSSGSVRRRRTWIEFVFRTLKHLLAAEACQVHSEDAYYGHLVLRLMGCFVLFYTSRVIYKGELTMEEIIFSLKHYWRFVDAEALELQALS